MNSHESITTLLNETIALPSKYSSSLSIAVSITLILATSYFYSSRLRRFVWNVVHFYREVCEESKDIEQLKAKHNASYKKSAQSLNNSEPMSFSWEMLHSFRISDGYIRWLDKQTQRLFTSLRSNLPVLFMIDRKLAHRMWNELIDCDLKYVWLAFVSLIVSKLIAGTFVITARANFFRLMYNELEPILASFVNQTERPQLATLHLHKIIENVVWQLLLEVLVRFFRSLFEYASSTLRFSRSSARRRRYLRSLLRKNDSFYREFPWDLYTVARNDPNSVDELLFDVLPTIFGNLVELVTASVGMLHIDVLLTAVAFLTWIPAKLGLFQIMWGSVRPFEIVHRDTQEKYQTKLREVFSNIQLIQSHSAEEFMVLEAEALSNKMDACAQFRIWPRFTVEIFADSIQRGLDLLVRVVAIWNALYNSTRFHISDFTKFEQYLSRLNFGWTSLCSSAMHGKLVVEQVYRYYAFVDQYTSLNDLDPVGEGGSVSNASGVEDMLSEASRESHRKHIPPGNADNDGGLNGTTPSSSTPRLSDTPDVVPTSDDPSPSLAALSAPIIPGQQICDNRKHCSECELRCTETLNKQDKDRGHTKASLSPDVPCSTSSDPEDVTTGKSLDTSSTSISSSSSAASYTYTGRDVSSTNTTPHPPHPTPPDTAKSAVTLRPNRVFSGIFASVQMPPTELSILYQKYMAYSVGRYRRSKSIDADLSPLEETLIPPYPSDTRNNTPQMDNPYTKNKGESTSTCYCPNHGHLMASASTLTSLFPVHESPVVTPRRSDDQAHGTTSSSTSFPAPREEARADTDTDTIPPKRKRAHPGRSLRVIVPSPESSPRNVDGYQTRSQGSSASSNINDATSFDTNPSGVLSSRSRRVSSTDTEDSYFSSTPRTAVAATAATTAGGNNTDRSGSHTPTLLSPVVTPRACIVQLESNVYRKQLSGTIRFRNVCFRYKTPTKDSPSPPHPIGGGATPATVSASTSAPRVSVSNTSPHQHRGVASSGAGALPFSNTTPMSDVAHTGNQASWVLRDLSFTVRKGTCVALVGSSGSGKTSIVQLLLRLQQHEMGSITIDDIPIQQYEPRSLRRQVGYVEQEPRMLTRSIRDNILLGVYLGTKKETGVGQDGGMNTSKNGGHTNKSKDRHPNGGGYADNEEECDVLEEALRRYWDEEVVKAAKLAQIHDDIMRLPKGYDTVLGKDGQLSGGQKQRLAIARAIVRNPSILILDEATSALDSETEQNLTLAIEQVMMNRTTLVIAHRLSTVVRADKILLIDNGQVVESGTHKELCARNGRYAQFVAAQLLPT